MTKKIFSLLNYVGHKSKILDQLLLYLEVMHDKLLVILKLIPQ